MKTRHIIFGIGLIAALLTACDPSNEVNPLSETNCSGTCQAIQVFPISSLSEAEMADLLFMREEEKLARDVYSQLYPRSFRKQNILQS